MDEAEIHVNFAGPHVTYQDEGRTGLMRFGVPVSGPMDRLSFDSAHAALGNPSGQTAIEISLGGVMLTCKKGDVTLAVTGGDFSVEHDGKKGSSWTVLTLRQGEKLNIRPRHSGSWAYLAFAGVLQANHWLGHSATHASSGFGGGAIKASDTLVVQDCDVREDREGEIPQFERAQSDPIRVVVGPQDQCFAESATQVFTSNPYIVSDAYDRMGMRLNGPTLPLGDALSIPSEPIVRGSVQVAGDGVPTVLLADHQTTGGYPKIATVISCDIDRLTQARAGLPLRFIALSPEDAIKATRTVTLAQKTYLDRISIARGTLEQRLMQGNLIQGMIFE